VILAGPSCAKHPGYESGGGASGVTGTGGAGGAAIPGGVGGVGGATIALTPPMGWNSWNKFQGNVTDALIRQTADAMVDSGMAAVGYQYVVIDDTWQSSRADDGTIVSDATRFPDMKALADYVHSKGLKFGLYSDRGTKTCGGHPGSFGFEQRDAATYAAWGVDYLKYDNCNPSPASQGVDTDFRAMETALRGTGRDIVFSVCAWWFYGWQTQIGQLRRTTTDIEDTWSSMSAILNRNGGDTTRYGSCLTCPGGVPGMCVVCTPTLPEAAYPAPGIAAYAGPGHWNDPDMLEVGNGGMSATEYRTHFSMWAMMAAPLIAGNDLRNMTPDTVEILTNAEVIAIDQDPLGVQGTPISTSTTLEVWSKRLAQPSTYAVALLNRTDAAADMTVTWEQLGLASANATVRDLWAKEDLGSLPTQFTATQVPSHGVVMLKVTGE